MNILTFFTLLVLGLVATTAYASDQDTCRIHRPKAYQAIGNFCSNNNVRVPSAYATAGKSDSAKKASVAIGGRCANTGGGAWVPSMFCYGQFWQMCASKVSQRWYGTDKCQKWTIKYDGDKLMLVAPQAMSPHKRDEADLQAREAYGWQDEE